MRLICLIVLNAVLSLAAQGDTIDLTPDQQTPDTFDPAKILITANKLIALGKESAEATLFHYAELPVAPHSMMAGEDRDYTTAWLCLLIYDPKPNSGLPWPGFGGPNFPTDARASYGNTFGSVSNTTWPRFPLALSHDVPFLLPIGYYMMGGQGEPGSAFLKRCQAQGVFHSALYPIPSHAEAQTALNQLISSPEWKTLNWHESPSANHPHDHQNWEIKFLQQQVDRVK